MNNFPVRWRVKATKTNLELCKYDISTDLPISGDRIIVTITHTTDFVVTFHIHISTGVI